MSDFFKGMQISIKFSLELSLGHSKNLILLFFIFQIVQLHNPSALDLHGATWFLDIFLMDFLQESRIHGSIN